MPAYFLGIHLGTRGLRAVIVDELGQVCGTDERGYETENPAGGQTEQDPEQWTRAAGPAVAGAIRRANVSPADIAAASVSAQRHSLIACTRSGAPVRPAIVWPDVRAHTQALSLSSHIDTAQLTALTGLKPDPIHLLPKILWLRENEPQAFEQAEIFTTPGPFLLHYMTGEWFMDYSTASDTMLYDISQRTWSARMLDLAGIAGESLPALCSGADIAGKITGEFAHQSNLPQGIPVAAGGGYEQCAAMGSGVIGPGLCSDIIDVIEPVGACTDSTAPHTAHLLETHDTPHGGSRFLLNPGFDSISNYQWFRDNFARMEIEHTRNTFRTAFDLMNEQASAAPAGAGGVVFLPFLSGARAPEWNPQARGVFAGLSHNHTREHIIRAVLESAAYTLRDNVQALEDAGAPVHEIRVVGGVERNPITEEIRAHVTGKPVSRTNVPETGAYGAALFAAVASGHFATPEQAAQKWVRVTRVIDPDPDTHEIYTRMYQRYRLLYDRLKDDFHIFSEDAL
jgi:sugar (pentulose or hexulose) kinase